MNVRAGLGSLTVRGVGDAVKRSEAAVSDGHEARSQG